MIKKLCLRAGLFGLAALSIGSHALAAPAALPARLTYYDASLWTAAKSAIAQNQAYYTSAKTTLVADADSLLNDVPNPVTNKTLLPASGDIHDYLSTAPYYWPVNPNNLSGPWEARDGQVNPSSRNNDTDQVRTSNMFDAVNVLTLAYYYTDDVAYATKLKQIIKVWFVDAATKVNPNVNHGQAIPGSGGTSGRSLGVIEWVDISTIVTALEVLDASGQFTSATDVNTRDKTELWLSQYYAWLTNPNISISHNEDTQPQNHGQWFDFQAVGLAIHLGKFQDAQNRLNNITKNRIRDQINVSASQPSGAPAPVGSFPNELGRTKSVNYSTMTLRALTYVAQMGRRPDVGVDLWNYTASNGANLSIAFNFLKPFAVNPSSWPAIKINPNGSKYYVQIEGSGSTNTEKATSKIIDVMQPLFSIGSTAFSVNLLSTQAQRDTMNNSLNYIERLTYPPITVTVQPTAAPAFSPAGGAFTSAQNVTITSATAGATIRYTTDGSTPTATTGTVYSSPVAVGSTTTLKAIAYKAGNTNSAVSSATYTITLPNIKPVVTLVSPAGNLVVQPGYGLQVEANATDADGSVEGVDLFIDGTLVRREGLAPYLWGHATSPNPGECNGLAAGAHVFKFVATDNAGLTGEASFTLTVQSATPAKFALAGAAVTASTFQTGNTPANSVDGSLTTRWSADGDGQWIRYDLGATKTVSYVRIAWLSGDVRTTTFDVQVSPNGTTWTNVLTNKVSSGTTTALEKFDFTDTNARYVRIVGHGNSANTWNSMNEIEIWGL